MTFEISNNLHCQDSYSTIQQSFDIIETSNKKAD